MIAMLKQIKAFVAVVESGSFTAAAKRLRMAQPAISLYIRQLEDAAGTRLVDRHKHAVKTTDAGGELLPAAQQLIEGHKRVDRLIRQLGRRKNVLIKVGSDSFSGHIRSRNRIVDDFIENFPNFELSVRYGTGDDLLSLLRAGEIDLAFMSLPIRDEGLEVLTIETIRHALLAPAGLWPDRTLRAEQLRGQKLLLAEENVPAALIGHIKSNMAQFEIAWVHPSEAEMSSRARMVRATGIPTLWLDGNAAEPGIRQVDDLSIHQLPISFHYQFGLVRREGEQGRGSALFWRLASEQAMAK